MAKCQICGENIKIIKSERGFVAEGICKKTGLEHVFTLEELSDTGIK